MDCLCMLLKYLVKECIEPELQKNTGSPVKLITWWENVVLFMTQMPQRNGLSTVNTYTSSKAS